MRMRGCVCFTVLSMILSGCMQLTLEPVDYSWGLESVLSVDQNGETKGPPKTPSFNAGELYLLELGGMPSNGEPTIRLIRNRRGYYFVTAPSFKHVYVFEPGVERLTLYGKIPVDEGGMARPAFNQRDPYIQLINGKQVLMLTEKGISGE